ncbi:MAG TPA: hypothetical protein V6D47_07515 [Oscillatoriaceae cyanobacterium]
MSIAPVLPSLPAKAPQRKTPAAPAAVALPKIATTPVTTTPPSQAKTGAIAMMAQAAQSLFERVIRGIQTGIGVIDSDVIGVINGIAGIHQILANQAVYTILLYLPKWLGKDIKWIANNPITRFLERLTANPWYQRVTGVFMKIAPVLGLICAPYDIRNCIQKWHDPKATMLDKVCTSVRLGTGILMCAGGVLGFVLPWLGAPAAGAMALNVAGKIGLVNLAASLPSIFDGVMGAFHWIGNEASKVF